MRTGLLSDVITLGYEIFLSGNKILLRYRKEGEPPREEALKIFVEIKNCKDEVINILKMGGTEVPQKTH